MLLLAGCATPGLTVDAGESEVTSAAAAATSASPAASEADPAEDWFDCPPSSPCPAEPIDNSALVERVFSPTSLTELAAAAEAVVVARATSDITQFDVGPPDIVMTVTRLEVVQTLFGQLKQPVVRIQQIGSPEACVDEAATFVVPGQTYVVALTPQILVPAEGPLEDYGVVGSPAGLWSFDGETVTSLDPTVASPLPDELTLAEFVAALG